MARGRPANPDRVPTEQEVIKKNLAAGAYSNENEDPTLAATIEDAANLLEQKAAILAQIQECRVLGTLLVNRKLGSEAQQMWVAAYLPRKSREENGEVTSVEIEVAA